MKKGILSLFAVVSLFTGCEHMNQVSIPQKTKSETAQSDQIVAVQTIDYKAEILGFYEEWKGTKYKIGGTTKKGIDSAGLTQKFFKEKFQLDIPRTASKQAKLGMKITKANLAVGDIIIFKRPKDYYTGIYLGDNEFMHSSFQGVKIDKLDQRPYTYLFHSARRIF